MAANHRKGAGSGNTWGLDGGNLTGRELAPWYPQIRETSQAYAYPVGRPPDRYGYMSPFGMSGDRPMDSSSRSEPSQEDWDQYDSDQIRRNNLNAAGALWIGGPVDLKEKKMYEADKRRREKAEREKEAAGVTKLKWMYIYNPKTGYMKAHQILLDSGARDGNFVSRQFVDEFGLEPKPITPIPFSQMAGSFICTEEAEVVWTPSPHSGIRSVVQCFVLPANSEIVNPHFGVRFMEKHGRELLDNLEPQNMIAYAAQKRCTEQEMQKIAPMLARLDEENRIQAAEREASQKKSSAKSAKRDKGGSGRKKASGSRQGRGS